jgi:hypothetical protein
MSAGFFYCSCLKSDLMKNKVNRELNKRTEIGLCRFLRCLPGEQFPYAISFLPDQ